VVERAVVDAGDLRRAAYGSSNDIGVVERAVVDAGDLRRAAYGSSNPV
jgi:hypothetical protein